MADPQEVDGWIAQLGQCKQLSEPDVKRLCEKVSCRPLFFVGSTRSREAAARGVCGAQGLDRVVTSCLINNRMLIIGSSLPIHKRVSESVDYGPLRRHEKY